MFELSAGHRVFVGFKMDGSLRRQVRAIEGPDRRYVAEDDTTFLSICRLGEDEYIGKVIDDGLSTARVDDVCRNIVSILQRLFPETRLPGSFEILACQPAERPSEP